MTQRLDKELSAREKGVVEGRHTEDVESVKEKLTDKVKQLLAHVTALEGEVVNCKETVADFNVKMKNAEKPGEDGAYKQDGLPARLH